MKMDVSIGKLKIKVRISEKIAFLRIKLVQNKKKLIHLLVNIMLFLNLFCLICFQKDFINKNTVNSKFKKKIDICLFFFSEGFHK